MIDPDTHTIRVLLHLLGAAVWVGGQLVMAALVPVLRRDGGDLAQRAARRFALVAWPFYVLLVATGVWSLVALDPASTTTGYQLVLMIKLVAVAVSGIAAFVHTGTDTPAVRAITGAGGLVAALAALALGVLLSS